MRCPAEAVGMEPFNAYCSITPVSSCVCVSMAFVMRLAAFRAVKVLVAFWSEAESAAKVETRVEEKNTAVAQPV